MFKKYKSLFIKDIDLELAKENERGSWINCDYLFEDVIRPELYINNLLNILDENKYILEKYKDYHPQELCNAFSKLYKSHNIVFILKPSQIDKFVWNGSTDAKNISSVWCNTNIVEAYQNYNEFKAQFEKFLKHEIIHREQQRRINNEKVIDKIIKLSRQSQIKYYGSKQEIMAYAWQIIFDFRIAGKPDEIIKQLISKDSFVANRFSKPLEAYKTLFEKDSDVLKLLYKYIYMYLDK